METNLVENIISALSLFHTSLAGYRVGLGLNVLGHGPLVGIFVGFLIGLFVDLLVGLFVSCVIGSTGLQAS